MSRRLWAAPVLLCVALTLAACGDANRFPVSSTPLPQAKPARTVAQTAAAEREHERILSSYGGSYDDPKLEALIGKTVDRLVAASDRPDQAYKVTILNSGAVNAFALPTGQLYVTRGLVALASDTSELSSVLSHEMAHVLAKHASIREDQARPAGAVTCVVTDMSNDPDLTAPALAKTKLTMASFSRAQEFEADGIGVGISARAHFDPFGASRFLSAMERNAAMKAGKASLDPRTQDFLSSHPATPERVQNAQNSARQFTSPERGERDGETYVAANVNRFIFASKQKSTESDRNARETVNSFRRLTLNEIQAARPLRIKVITVQPGDTVESLSHRMSGVDRAAERFRILNGLEAHAQVKVRDKVKIVVD